MSPSTHSRLFCLVASLSLGAGCAANLGGTFSAGDDDAPSRVTLPDDGADPVVLLLEPGLGSVMPGTEVRLVGHVDDDSPVTLVTDGGETIPVASDGTFDYPVTVAPGSHRLRLVATDAGGRSGETFTAFASGAFVDTGTMVEGAVLADSSAAVLADIAEGAASELTAASFNRQLWAANPIADGWWGDVDLLGETHGAVAISLVPSAGRITATVEVDQITVGARANVRIGSASGELRARGVRVTATIALGAVDGSVVASVESATAVLDSAVVNINNFPGVIENLSAVRDAVHREVEGALGDAVREMLPPLITDAIASLPEGDTVDVLGAELALSASVRALDVDAAGIGATFDLGIAATSPDPAREAIGYLTLPHDAAPAVTDELAVSVAYDALNAAFAAAWTGGALDQRLDGIEFGGGPLTAGAVGLLLPFTTGRAPGTAPVSIDLHALLPPMLVPSPDGALEVQAADVRVTFVAVVDGADVEIATVSVGIFADAEPRIEAGALAFTFGELRVSADVIDGTERAPGGEELSALLDELVPSLTADLLAGAAVGIPPIYGYDVVLSRIDTTGGYLTLEASLE